MCLVAETLDEDEFEGSFLEDDGISLSGDEDLLLSFGDRAEIGDFYPPLLRKERGWG